VGNSSFGAVEVLDHHVRRLDQGRGGVALPEPQLLRSFRSDDGCYLQLADCQHNFGHKAGEPHAYNFAGKLISSTDVPVPFARLSFRLCSISFKVGFEARERDTMMSAGGLSRLESPVENPFLDGWVADPQHPCRFARR